MKLAIILLLGLLAGCQLGTSTGPQFDNTGTEGIRINVHPASTENILMCQDANILLDLYNMGTSDTEGIYNLILEDQIVSTAKKKGGFALEGRSPINPAGEFTQLTFKLKSKTLPAQLETYSTPFILNACYPYITY